MKKITFSDFATNQFRKYSLYDCDRSIPHLIDGFKITQRKIIYTLIKIPANQVVNGIKVNNLANFTSIYTDFHHGEDGISGVICGMAQDYPGSNNANLLEPIGQFGSEIDPEPSAPRYITTRFNNNFRKYYKSDDDDILNYQYSDELRIEPLFYLPILPMILVNGSQGIATGYASKTFNHNPLDLKNAITQYINGKDFDEPQPWYANWNGTIEKGIKPNQWVFIGDLDVINTTKIIIHTLPIGMYQDDMKGVLVTLSESGFIKDFDDECSIENGLRFVITAPRTTTALTKEELLNKFKLVSRDTQNLTYWLPNGKIKPFECVKDVIKEFVDYRLDKFEIRRQNLIRVEEDKLSLLNEKIKFIEYYLVNTQFFKGANKPTIFSKLQSEGFTMIDELMSQKIYSLTLDSINELNVNIQKTQKVLDELNKTNAKKLFLNDLKEIK